MATTPVNKQLNDQFSSSDEDITEDREIDNSPIKMTPQGKHH
jgi:hypothetical protein